MKLHAERTHHVFNIWYFMTLPEIWATVAEDGINPQEYMPDVQGDCWLSMTAGDQEIGYYKLAKINGVTLEIHAQVLPKHRKLYSKASGDAALGWIKENEPECQKVIAWVPVIYPNVKDFTCSFGFQVEGINRKSYRKNGELHDQWLLGITRDEM